MGGSSSGGFGKKRSSFSTKRKKTPVISSFLLIKIATNNERSNDKSKNEKTILVRHSSSSGHFLRVPPVVALRVEKCLDSMKLRIPSAFCTKKIAAGDPSSFDDVFVSIPRGFSFLDRP